MTLHLSCPWAIPSPLPPTKHALVSRTHNQVTCIREPIRWEMLPTIARPLRPTFPCCAFHQIRRGGIFEFSDQNPKHFVTAHNKPYALTLAMLSIFVLFTIKLNAFRWGTVGLAHLGTSQGLCLIVDREFLPPAIVIG